MGFKSRLRQLATKAISDVVLPDNSLISLDLVPRTKAITMTDSFTGSSLNSLFGAGSPSTRSDRLRYAAEVGDPLRTPLIMAAVKWLGRTIHEAPLYVVKRNDQGREIKRLARHPVLSVINRPNEWYSGKQMMKAVGASRHLNGNSYLLLGRDQDLRITNLFYEPHFTIRPRWYNDQIYGGNTVKVEDKDKFIAFYEVYRTQTNNIGGNWYRVETEDVLHSKDGLDPANTRLGLSPMGALLADVYTDMQRAHFSATVLSNIGMIPFVVSPRETNGSSISPEQADKIKAELELRSRSERGKPIVAGRAIRIDQLGFSPQDMDLGALDKIPKEHVAAILGPNMQVLGFATDSKTFSNYVEAREDAYESFLIPLHKELAADFTHSILREFDADEMTCLEYDFNEVGAMQGQRAKSAEMWGKMFTDGITDRYTAKVATGQPVTDDDKVYADELQKPTSTALPTQYDRQGNERLSPKDNKGPVLEGKRNG